MKKVDAELLTIAKINELFPDTIESKVVTRQQLIAAKEHLKAENIIIANYVLQEYKIGHGQYSLDLQKTVQPIIRPVAPTNVPTPQPVFELTSVPQIKQVIQQSFIPKVDNNYVKFGIHSDVNTIIKSKMFYPCYIYGESGNGKTMTIEQVCAELGRECIKINLNAMTDEDQLIGTKTLVDGNVEIIAGVVIAALKRGAILLMDEIDCASANAIMAIQSILNGGDYFFKLKNEVITPAPGFNIIATGNTKGKGSDSGKYIGTNILNDAFLERFAVTFIQEFPSQTVELKIVKNVMNDLGYVDDKFATDIVKWADTIRRTYNDDAIDENISTRRIVHIIKTYSIFKNRRKAIELCTNRFDAFVQESFVELFFKISDEDSAIDINQPQP